MRVLSYQLRGSWALGIALLLLFALATVGAGWPSAQAQEDWRVTSFHAEIAINADSSLDIVETIVVDFGDTERHGIIRAIPVRYEYKEDEDRVYHLTVYSVENGGGSILEFSTSRAGADVEIKIGDPDRTVSGAQTYVIAYRVDGVLNSFTAQDELYWNVNGNGWPATERVTAEVRLPGGLRPSTECYQGAAGSDEPCGTTVMTADLHRFESTRPLAAGEGLTIVSAIRKGAVAGPPVFTEPAQRDENEVEQLFDISPLRVVATAVLAVIGAAGLAAMWWLGGRDREFTAVPYLTGSTQQRLRRPFSRRQIVVEYAPPEGLAPAEIGIIEREELDHRDATATIVHLAVRGHLTIEEVDKAGLFGGRDFRLTKRTGPDDLRPFEREIYAAIFKDRETVTLSDLKSVEYGKALERSHGKVAERAVRDRWFTANPRTVQRTWAGLGGALVIGGGFAAWGLGSLWGAGLLGIPIVTTGLGTLALAGAMPARTAEGSELLRRVLGFRLFIETAESRRAEFYEKASIFAEYLPYAIGFECVDRWADAFEGINTQQAVEGWYTGSGAGFAYSSRSMATGLAAFSGGMQSAIRASTPGGKGSSGFGGGFSGGGGGGGGGRAW